MRPGAKDWIGGAVLVAELVVCGPAAAECRRADTILVHAEISATVPRAVMEDGKSDVVRIYKAIGLNVLWTDDPGVVPTALIVKIVPEAMARHLKVPLGALGVALRTDERSGGRFAYVLYDRIDGAASMRRMDAGRILGVTMAHELGHLLLPHGNHAASGLMRAAWDPLDFRNAAAGLLQFTMQQGEQIRGRCKLGSLDEE